MANADRQRANALYVDFKGVAIGAYRTWDVNRTADTIDKTAGAETSKSYIASLKDGTASITFAYEGTAGTALLAALAPGAAAGTLRWGPEGTAAGKAKGEVMAIVTALSDAHPYDGLMTHNVSFQFTGDLVSDPASGTW